MSPWPKYPVLYEINTWVWLGELSQRAGQPVTLADVPAAEWDRIAAGGFDAVWLMGVWERSPAGIAISLRNEGLLADFRRALPDFTAEDNVGSPYCVRRYVVDAHLGGPAGLAAARAALRERGIRLVLDFVPNHVAPDHPWVFDHPEYFIQGIAEDARRDPASYIEVAGHVFACGRDPYFPAWPDVLQLNVFAPGLRQQAIATLEEIATQCDGLRCDMAMLVMNGIFDQTWGARAGTRPAEDYWPSIIRHIRAQWPEFRFIAEAYWGLEGELRRQGFDHCYDKTLYDRLAHGSAESVREQLQADSSDPRGHVRFIENHDEPRAAAAFPMGQECAAAVALLTLPGVRLLHEGQFEGRKVRLPVFLARRPAEPIDAELAAFYEHLLAATRRTVFRDGDWRLCECTGWPDNQSFRQLLAWSWTHGDTRYLIVINYRAAPSQGRVHVPWGELRGKTCRLHDESSGASYERRGDEMRGEGLYVELPAWGGHFFEVVIC